MEIQTLAIQDPAVEAMIETVKQKLQEAVKGQLDDPVNAEQIRQSVVDYLLTLPIGPLPTVTPDSYVSSTVVRGLRRVPTRLNVVFQASKETRQYKMSWRRAKVKIAKYIKREAQIMRFSYTLQPLPAINWISLKAIVRPMTDEERAEQRVLEAGVIDMTASFDYDLYAKHRQQKDD